MATVIAQSVVVEFYPDETRWHSYQHKNRHDSIGNCVTKVTDETGLNTILELIWIFFWNRVVLRHRYTLYVAPDFNKIEIYKYIYM